MKIYFLSSTRCALTVNGAYFGITDLFERFADISLQDGAMITFTPENALPISFFLNENIRFSPPAGCEVYLLRDAIAVYARDFPPNDFSLRPIAQSRSDNTLVSVFSQGNVQLSIQTGTQFYSAVLPPDFSTCEIAFCNAFSHPYVLLKSPKSLAVFSSTAQLLLCETVLSYQLSGDTLTALLPLQDSVGRTAEGVWQFSEAGLQRTAFTLRQVRTQNGDLDGEKIKLELLPYAFFESLLIGAETDGFLCEELLSEKEKLRAFLGDFCDVCITADPFVCALLRKKGERLYEASYFSVTVENGKISDIRSQD